MIISCSRRTDIPAFYSKWLMNRIRQGFVVVPNPFNPKQVSRIGLGPDSVTAFVFWTRWAKPLMRYLPELDERGYPYYFLYTLNNYPAVFETNAPDTSKVIENIRELSGRIGPGRVIWRYDPIFYTEEIDFDFHLKNFEYLSSELKGTTKKVIISIITFYSKTERRMLKTGAELIEYPVGDAKEQDFLREMSKAARRNEMKMEICSYPGDLSHIDIEASRCVDNRLLEREFGIQLPYKKDKGQRPDCTCHVSRDIGMNNTCIFGCRYCYATMSQRSAKERYKRHDPDCDRLIR